MYETNRSPFARRHNRFSNRPPNDPNSHLAYHQQQFGQNNMQQGQRNNFINNLRQRRRNKMQFNGNYNFQQTDQRQGADFLARLFGRPNNSAGHYNEQMMMRNNQLNNGQIPFRNIAISNRSPNTSPESVANSGFLQKVTNPNNINSFINNTQQMIKTAQSISPLVQQYAPMVRNLPAMWAIYRGLKSDSTDSDESPKETTERKEQTINKNTESEAAEEVNKSNIKVEQPKNDGKSLPKLYI